MALISLGLGIKSVQAQGGVGITYTTGFQLQNLGLSTATVSIAYYNQAGTVVQTVSDTIAPSGSRTYFPIGPASPFNGSVVVSSDQQLVAIANQIAGGSVVGGGAAGGFSSGATTVNLPLIMRNNSGINTWFNVQNAGSAAATVRVSYLPGSAGSATSEVRTVQPGAATTFDQIGNAGLGATFVGSAVVTSTQPIVSTAMQVANGSFKAVFVYNGFTAGSTSVALPLVMANNSGFFTGIQVQNAGTSATNVTITYSSNSVAGMGTPVAEVASVPAGQSHTFLQAGGQWTGKYVGSAIVTNSGAQPLVAIVNQVKTGVTSLGSAYEGFNPASATSKVSIPLVMANNSGYLTAIQVQNVGGSPCSVNVTYAPNTVAGMGTPSVENHSIATNQSFTYFQAGGQWTGRYVGSAVVSGASCSLLAIVNEVNLVTAANDQLDTYDGFNY